MSKAQIIPSDPTEIVPAPTPPTPEMLIAQALEKGLSVETIERLLAMRKELKAEAAKEAYDEAMALFQAECPVIEKEKKVKFDTKAGGSVDYFYAPMDAIVRQTKDIIAKHGFSYNFKTVEDVVGVTAICIVKHKMGHSDSSDFTVERGGTQLMSAAQKTSGAATYAKRQAFCNAFGITTGDEDNDAVKSKEEAKAEVLATQEQRNEIDRLAEQAGVTKAEVAARCRADYGCSITEINRTQAMGIIERLKLKIKNSKPTT